MRQLEQAEIYFDIEQELANRLAEAAGGKPVTRDQAGPRSWSVAAPPCR